MNQMEWKEITQLPEKSMDVIIAFKPQHIDIPMTEKVRYNKKQGFMYNGKSVEIRNWRITNWMPMPSHPQIKRNGNS